MKTINGNFRVVLKLVILLFVVFNLSAGCSKSDSSTTNPGADEVFIQSFAFNPSTITVPVNTTVTWTNKDAVAHTVTSDTGGLFDSGNLNTNATYAHKFTSAGTFNYHCTIHPTMVARVIVQ